MNIKDALAIAALLCLGLAPSVGSQSAAQEVVAQKQPLAIPVTAAPAAGKPAPSVQCVLSVGPTSPIAALAFQPGGTLLAAGGYQEVLLWDMATPKLALRIGSGQLGGVVHAVAFTKDGKLLAVGDGVPRSAGAVKIFNVQTGQLVVSFEAPKDAIYSLAFSPDGKYLAAGSADSTAYIFSVGKLQAQSLVNTTAAHLAAVDSQKKAADAALAAVNNQVAAATTAHQAAETAAQQAQANAKAVAEDAAKTAEEKQQAAADATAKRTAADAAKTALAQAQQGVQPAQAQVTAVAATLAAAVTQKQAADAALVAITNQLATATTALQAAETAAQQAEANSQAVAADAAKTAPEKQQAAADAAAKRAAAGAAKVALAQAQQYENEVVHTIAAHRDLISDVSFSVDGKFLSTASADGSARVWEVGTWKATAVMQQLDSVHASAFNPNGQILAVAVGGSVERKIHLRRRTDAVLTRAIPTGGVPLDMIWAAQGNRIYAACSDNTIRAHNAGNGGLLKVLVGHTDWVYTIALNADAAKLASGSADGTIKLWNTADGTLLATLVQLTPHTDEWLIITPQGYLATSSAAAIQWKTDNVTTPPDQLTALFQNAGLLPKAIAGEKVAPLTLE